MIRGLRHIALRLWISLILGTFLAFWAMPLVNQFFPGHDPQVALAILAALYFVSGFVMTMAGEWLVLYCVKEALNWERAGLGRRSEELFLKALRLYDSPLISPFRGTKVPLILAGSLAKFSLTSTTTNPIFERAVKAFLRMAPNEEEIALLWLKRISRGTPPGREEHEILTLVAEANFNHSEIRELAAQILAASARNDFTARKVYKAVQETSGLNRESLADMNRETLADMNRETLADMNRETLADMNRETLADMNRETLADMNRETLADMNRETLADMNRETLADMNRESLADMNRETLAGSSERLDAESPQDTRELRGFEILPRPESLSMKSKRVISPRTSGSLPTYGAAGAVKKGPGKIVLIIKDIVGGVSIIFQRFWAFLKSGYNFFHGRKALAKRVKWSAALIVASILAGFAVNTMFHLFHTTPPQVVVKKFDVELPKPFTIQVSAYLNKSHADEYVANLKEKGLDAYIYKADGGGRTWFIIRISRFADKESAAAYGNSLKQQHLIDDFFVDNNE